MLSLFAHHAEAFFKVEINGRDYPIVQGVVFVYALMFVLTNLATDLTYRYIDPRVRF